jgi:hypothetical protein
MLKSRVRKVIDRPQGSDSHLRLAAEEQQAESAAAWSIARLKFGGSASQAGILVGHDL